MNKEWSQPRVWISGATGLVLAFVASWLLVTTTVTSIPCRPTSSPVWIDLSNTSDSFSTVVCAGQVVRWKSAEQLMVTFPANNGCVTGQLTYPLNQICTDATTIPSTNFNCSQQANFKQPYRIISYGWCDYTVAGLKDPRVIIIGK